MKVESEVCCVGFCDAKELFYPSRSDKEECSGVSFHK